MKNIATKIVLIVLGDKSRIKEKKYFCRRRKKLNGNIISKQMVKPRIDLTRTESRILYLCINFVSIVFLCIIWSDIRDFDRWKQGSEILLKKKGKTYCKFHGINKRIRRYNWFCFWFILWIRIIWRFWRWIWN